MCNKAHEENCKQLEFEMKKTTESEKKKCESERILPKAIRTFHELTQADKTLFNRLCPAMSD